MLLLLWLMAYPFKSHLKHSKLMNVSLKTMKAQLGPGALIPFATVLIVSIVLITVGAYITYSVGNTLPNTVANTVATNGTNALATVSTWFTILGIVFIAAVVIGLLMYAFGGRKGGAY
jgi:uncharacterized membrane protein